VNAEVFAGEDLQADAGVPAELGRVDALIGVVEQLDLAAIPARPAQQEWRHAATAHPQEERRLDRGLCDLLVQELERLPLPVQRDLEPMRPVRIRT
jgi:hypothetical protein